jgi:uncharacterized membrane protein
MKRVTICKKRTGAGIVAASLVAALMLNGMPVYAAESGIDMSTEYPGVTVKAGDTVSFPLDFTTLDGEAHDVSLSVESMDEGWDGYFKGSSNEITMVHINAADETDGATTTDLANFYLTIPDDTEEGVYTVTLDADAGSGDTDTLELQLKVTEVVNGESDFTTEYAEQQGSTGTSFSFDATIQNNRNEEQSYSLSSKAPEGWSVTFTPSGESMNVASVTADASSSQGLTIGVTPPENVEKGDYTITCTATSANETLTTDLTVSITGTYTVTLSTTDGRLSCDAESSKPTTVDLVVTNDGNVDLENLTLTGSASTDWEVSFSEDTIESLAAGESKNITATITPSENSITGDYVTYITVSNTEASSSAEIRVTVKTATSWGIVAIGIIVILVAALGFIFKKYGRR